MCVHFWSPVIYLSDIEMFFFISSFILRAGYRVWLFKILLYNCNNEQIFVHAHSLFYYHVDYLSGYVILRVATLVINFYTSSLIKYFLTSTTMGCVKLLPFYLFIYFCTVVCLPKSTFNLLAKTNMFSVHTIPFHYLFSDKCSRTS